MTRSLALSAILLASLTSASAQEAKGLYSRFDRKTCKTVEKDQESGGVLQRCKGSGGFDIWVSENDLRVAVGYGPNGRKQKAIGQNLNPFNSIHETVEFRRRPGAKQPFAAILRHRTADEDGKERGQVLVITKIDGGEACHMAYIDALANSDANALARQTADSMAATFNCANDEAKRVGAAGKSRM